jgi:hypothetical protein
MPHKARHGRIDTNKDSTDEKASYNICRTGRGFIENLDNGERNAEPPKCGKAFCEKVLEATNYQGGTTKRF